MLRWLHRPVNAHGESDARNEIARAVRAVRAACFGRACLAKCAKRMTAAAPLRRRMRCGGAAFAVAALLLLGYSARAVVTCTWNGSGYTCSGEGDVVEVIGGITGGGEGSIVTNVVGVCTNCVAMSPEYVAGWKDTALEIIGQDGEYDGLLEDCRNAITYSQLIQSYLSVYTNSVPLSGMGGDASFSRDSATNFLHSVGFYAGETPKNKAAATAKSLYTNPNSTSTTTVRRYIDAYESAAIAYNDFAPSANSSIYAAQDIETNAVKVQTGLRSLRSMVEDLSDEECTAQYVPGDGEGSGGEGSGGGSLTNQVSGNWCTYDQGEAIKELLNDIKQWSERQTNYLRAISNRVVSIDETIKNALFTSYTHIPTEEELQTSWQELYLTGSNPNFPGYASTNIVARIELLLAGISGVLTNVSDYASQEDFADESLDSTNLVENAMGDFTNQFANVMQGRAASSRSVGDSLIRLYQKFRTWSGTPFSTETLINSYSVEFESGKAVDVPGFSAPATTLPWANLIRVICRSAMSVIWILMTVAVFVRFQIAFFQWCFKYVKWAVEVLQGLFV